MPLSPYTPPVGETLAQPTPSAQLPPQSGGIKQQATTRDGRSGGGKKKAAIRGAVFDSDDTRSKAHGRVSTSDVLSPGTERERGRTSNPRSAVRIMGATSILAAAAITSTDTAASHLYTATSKPKKAEEYSTLTIPARSAALNTARLKGSVSTIGAQTSIGRAMSAAQPRNRAYSKRMLDDSGDDGLCSPLTGDAAGESNSTWTPPAAPRARVPPSSCTRKRVCLKRVTAEKNGVDAPPALLSDLLLSEQRTAMTKMQAYPTTGDRTRNDCTFNEFFPKRVDDKQRSAGPTAHVGHSYRGGAQHVLPFARESAPGEEWIAAYGAGSGAEAYYTSAARRNPRVGHFSSSVDGTYTTHLLHLQQQTGHTPATTVKHTTVRPGTKVPPMRMASLYPSSETTASVSSGEYDHDRSQGAAGANFGAEFGHGQPFARSTAATLECLVGSLGNEIFPTSPLLDPLWETTDALDKHAGDDLDKICLESFELDIPDVMCPSTAPGSSWSTRGGDDSCSSFYCNDELATTPSGLVGDGWRV